MLFFFSAIDAIPNLTTNVSHVQRPPNIQTFVHLFTYPLINDAEAFVQFISIPCFVRVNNNASLQSAPVYTYACTNIIRFSVYCHSNFNGSFRTFCSPATMVEYD